MIPIINGNYSKIVIPLIKNVKTNFDIVMYQWGYYPYRAKTDIQNLNYEIKAAAKRGVSMRAILHPGNPMDHLMQKNAQMASFLTAWGAQVKFGKRGGCTHAKMILLDKTIAILGSHNLSQRSLSTNVEVGIVIEGSWEIREFQEYFNFIWEQN